MNDHKFLDIITTVRFPLIFLVLLSHSIGFSEEPVYWGDFSQINVYNFITQLLSHNLANITVCVFFFISGYLFFRKVDVSFGPWYFKKLKKRINTVLVPFLLWNIIAILAIVLKNIVFSLWGQYDIEEMNIVKECQVLKWFLLPADYPTWYLRDLFILILLSPAFYYLIIKTKEWFLPVLIVVYLLPWTPHVINMWGLFFFPLGCYCSILSVDVWKLVKQHKTICYAVAVVTLLLSVFFNSSPNHYWYLRFFYPFGAISFINLFDFLTMKNPKFKDFLQSLAPMVFFTYVAHEIYILGWCKGLMARFIGNSLPEMYLRYFMVPVLVAMICCVLYKLLNRFTPKALNFLCGGR